MVLILKFATRLRPQNLHKHCRTVDVGCFCGHVHSALLSWMRYLDRFCYESLDIAKCVVLLCPIGHEGTSSSLQFSSVFHPSLKNIIIPMKRRDALGLFRDAIPHTVRCAEKFSQVWRKFWCSQAYETSSTLGLYLAPLLWMTRPTKFRFLCKKCHFSVFNFNSNCKRGSNRHAFLRRFIKRNLLISVAHVQFRENLDTSCVKYHLFHVRHLSEN